MTPESFDKLHKSVERIEKAIMGDEDMGHRGLADRVAWIEKKLLTHERQLWIWVGGLSLLAFLMPIMIRIVIG